MPVCNFDQKRLVWVRSNDTVHKIQSALREVSCTGTTPTTDRVLVPKPVTFNQLTIDVCWPIQPYGGRVVMPNFSVLVPCTPTLFQIVRRRVRRSCDKLIKTKLVGSLVRSFVNVAKVPLAKKCSPIIFRICEVGNSLRIVGKKVLGWFFLIFPSQRNVIDALAAWNSASQDGSSGGRANHSPRMKMIKHNSILAQRVNVRGLGPRIWIVQPNVAVPHVVHEHDDNVRPANVPSVGERHVWARWQSWRHGGARTMFVILCVAPASSFFVYSRSNWTTSF